MNDRNVKIMTYTLLIASFTLMTAFIFSIIYKSEKNNEQQQQQFLGKETLNEDENN